MDISQAIQRALLQYTSGNSPVLHTTQDAARLIDAPDESMSCIVSAFPFDGKDVMRNLLQLCFQKLRVGGFLCVVLPHKGAPAAGVFNEDDVIEVLVGIDVPSTLVARSFDDSGSGLFALVAEKKDPTEINLPPYTLDAEPAAALREFVVDGELVLSRLDGIGDMVFMAEAVKTLKATLGDVKFVLHTRPQYADIHKLIGFDDVTCDTDVPRIALNMALEHHTASLVIDRVSLWEDVLHLPIGDSAVSITPPPGGVELLRGHKHYDPNKPSLYFSPFSKYAARSFPVRQAFETAVLLSRRYNVVMVAPHTASPLPSDTDDGHVKFVERSADAVDYLGVAGCCVFHELSIPEWFSLVSACDVAVSCDTAGVYVAAAVGTPAVGFYEHVAPWLRLHRFSNVRGVSLRQSGCRCDHHGPCPLNTEVCKSALTWEFVERNVAATLNGDYGYFDPDGNPLMRPRLGFFTGPTTSAIDDHVKAIARGMDYTVNSGCEVEIEVVDNMARRYVWDQMTRYVGEQPWGRLRPGKY